MKLLSSTALFAGVLLATSAASAAIVGFDNTSSHPGGVLTFGTNAAPGVATLSNGVIDLVSRNDVGASYAVSSAGASNCGSPMSGFGCVNFTTGSFVGQTTNGNTTSYIYNGGGSLSINGTADGASGLLFSSNGFDGFVTLSVNNSTGLAALSATLLSGTLNSNLAAALGVSPITPGGTDTNSSIMITFTGGTGSGMATTNSVQLSASAVPEPTSVLLMSSGLLGVAGFARRRARKQS